MPTPRGKFVAPTAWAILVVVILLTTAAPLGAAPGHPGSPGRVDPRGPTLASRTSGGSVYDGFSERTLDLLNGSVVPGDDLAVNGLAPGPVVYDPTNQRVYVLSEGPPTTCVDVLNATSDALVTNIPVGPSGGPPGSPLALAGDWATSTLFVANSGSDAVTVINTTSDQVVGNVTVAPNPTSLVFDPADGAVYALSPGGVPGIVSVIDAASDTVTGHILVGTGVGDIVLDSANGDIDVLNTADGNLSVINGSSNTLVGTVAVGVNPLSLAVDNATNVLYVLDEGLNGSNVTLLNGTSGALEGNVSIGAPAYPTASSWEIGALDVDGANGRLYVADTASDEVTVIVLGNDTVVATVPVGSQPTLVTSETGLGSVLVLNPGSSNLTLLSPSNNSVMGNISLLDRPLFLTVDASSGSIFVPANDSDLIQVGNGTTRTILANVSVGDEPDQVLYDNASGDLYVSELDAGEVGIIDGASDGVLATVSTGLGAAALALDLNDSRVYVANAFSDTVSAISTSTHSVVSTTTVGNFPDAAAWDPASDQLFVANLLSSNVSVLDGSTGALVASVPVVGDPSAVAFDPSNGEVYVEGSGAGSPGVTVLNGGTNLVVANITLAGDPHGLQYDTLTGDMVTLTYPWEELQVISSSTNVVTDSIALSPPAGPVPTAMAIDPASGLVWVAQWTTGWVGSVLVVNLTSNATVANVSVGTLPQAVAVDPAGGLAVVENLNSDTLSLIALGNDTVVATVPVGAGMATNPAGGGDPSLAVNPVTGAVSAANEGQGTLSLVGMPGPYPLNFTESGLPLGTNWSVALDGSSRSSTTSTVGFSTSNGTYSFSIPAVAGFLPTPSNGTVTINGSGLVEALTFAPTFGATFDESGLPSGTVWGVTLNRSSEQSANSTLRFDRPNGTYNFSIANVPGWRSNLYAGQVHISGSGVLVQLTWTAMVYDVNFTAAGLTPGRSWAVILNETAYRSSTSSIGLSLANGTYNYSVAGAPGFAPLPASGTVTVDGAAVAVPINFTEGFLVEFNETGLPVGTVWAVTLNGSLNFSSTPTVSFEVTNGTLTYVLSNVPGWRAASYTGFVPVLGTNVTVDINWSRTVYSVGFTELGLPMGTSWSVSVGGNLSVTSSSTTLVTEPNGSYAFSIANVPGWRANAYFGTVNVTGEPVGVTIFWDENEFPVLLSESGLPTGQQWSASLNGGTPTFSNAGVITFQAGNGSLSYQVGNVGGWRANDYSGALTVNDGPTGATVLWTRAMYTVAVHEVGLPAGTVWGITTSGTTNRTGGTAIEFPATNGTLLFNVSNVPGWRADAYNDSVSVAGSNANATVHWTRTTYTLTLSAVGLAPGTGWTAVVNGSTASSSSFLLAVPGLPNGTYSLVIPAASGESATGVPSTVTITGASVSLNVTFSPGPTKSSPLGLSGTELGLVVGVVVLVVVALLAMLLLRRRRPPPSKAGPDGDSPAEPSAPEPEPVPYELPS
jgi:YVTN family beta-propeller protein